MTRRDFAYAQARLQARHAQRPDEQLWRRLQGIATLEHYLQVAAGSALQHWVAGLQVQRDSHAIELLLRSRLRSYIDEVAGWLPKPWQAAVRWTKRLQDLPVIQYLLSDREPPAWVARDPVLAAFAGDSIDARRLAMSASDCLCLVQHWRPPLSIQEVWLQCWEQSWPDAPRYAAGLRRLAGIYAGQSETVLVGSSDVRGERRAALVSAYTRAFRRYAFEPGSAIAHIWLVALDVQRLRSGVLHRLLFPETLQAS